MASRVYIGRLSYRASERDIEHFFRGYGRIRDIVLKNGFGFVEFDDQRDADDAVYDLNGKELCGERVILEFSRRGPRMGGRDSYGGRGGSGGGGGGYDRYGPPRRDSRYGPPQQTRHRMIVENLSTRCSWQDLKDMMRQCGEVTFADAHKTHRNEGREDLLRAIEKMQGKEVNGRKMKLVDDSEEAQRSRSRSRSHSRSRSRSRSHSCSRSRSRSSRRSRSKSKSRSKSRSPKKDRDEKSKSRSRSRSKSRSKSNRSGSPANGNAKHNGDGDTEMKDDNRSRSGSPRDD